MTAFGPNFSMIMRKSALHFGVETLDVALSRVSCELDFTQTRRSTDEVNTPPG